MCIIAALNPGKTLSKEVFDRCWDNNPDGFGMSYLYKGTIRIKKTMDKRAAWSIYHNIERIAPLSAKILHFRIGTHGIKDEFNCHPFTVNNDLVFAHNGIIKNVPVCPDKYLSDTQIFNNLILKNLPDGFQYNKTYKLLLEKFIDYSKLVFMSSENILTIFNEEAGEWDKGIWFSNKSYLKPKYTIPASTTTISTAQPSLVYTAPKKEEPKPFTFKEDYTYDSASKSKYSMYETESYGSERCVFCAVWKDDCDWFEGVGSICQDCIEEIQSIGVDIHSIKNKYELIDAYDAAYWEISKEDIV